MITIAIPTDQLRKALEEIEAGESVGLMHCLAVFKVTEVGRGIGDSRAEFDDILMKAHPTDGNYNWGWSHGNVRTWEFKNGKLTRKAEFTGRRR